MTPDLNPYASPAAPPPLVAAVAVDDAGWTIDFDLGIDDYIAWNMHFQRTSPTARRQLVRAWILVSAMVLAIVILLPSLVMDWPASLMVTGLALVPAVILLCFFPFLRRWQVQKIVRQMYVEGHNYNLIGPRRMSISRDFLAVQSPWSQSLMRWAGIAEIQRDREALYFCIASSTALIAPRRAFASPEQFERFAEAAAGFHAAAKPLPVG